MEFTDWIADMCDAVQEYLQENAFDHSSLALLDVANDATSDGASNETSVVNFDDPMYDDQQWILDMIQIEPVWYTLGYTGQGVHVRINDNGVETNHSEFLMESENGTISRFSVEDSCPSNFEPAYDDSVSTLTNSHGTVVAGIVGAAANNEFCGVGMAPMVTLSSCSALVGSETFLDYNIEAVDISQNSYERPACRRRLKQLRSDPQRRLEQVSATSSPLTCPFTYSYLSANHPCIKCPWYTHFEVGLDEDEIEAVCQAAIIKHCRNYYEFDVEGCSDFLDILIGAGETCTYNVLSDTARTAITHGIQSGRQGKGTIYVFASGNSYASGDLTVIKGYTNTRYTISVGAVGKDGLHASYSTPGTSLFVVAPAGDGTGEGHVATMIGDSCGKSALGTSFSCPVVSGVIALVLEANPDLTWRDVQAIVATTSTPVLDDPWDTTATTNGGGYWHSNLYGFGIINAVAAVQAALEWELYPNELMFVQESGLVNLTISDDPTETLSSVIKVADEMIAESIIVYLNIHHLSRGDLNITLQSPSGTQSVLHSGKLPESTVYRDSEKLQWKLQTVRHYGENIQGTWTLRVSDVKEGDVNECVDAPFDIDYLGVSVTCSYLEKYSICSDQGISPSFGEKGNWSDLFSSQDASGLTMTEACCSCGGGYLPETYVDELREWTLVMYGHNVTYQKPTLPPHFSGKENTAYDDPTGLWNDTVSPAPSSSSPYLRPSEAPSGRPSTAETDSPVPSNALMGRMDPSGSFSIRWSFWNWSLYLMSAWILTAYF
eukprot:Nitzschia sp. Nitz4//scaffold148_size54725//22811//25138//NITZ4_006656-RA/size54725-processed-gene-0.13-mRNA-1//1//CDS//3329536742//3023//frame0